MKLDRMIWTLSSAAVSAVVFTGCVNGESDDAAPMATIDALLDLHGMRGRMPEERSDETRRKAVDETALKRLFLDFESEDPFLANLYVGFVVGVLARHQHMLVLTRRGNRATVHAGDLPVKMMKKNDHWLIVLKKTIPDAIRKRAEAEQQRLKQQRIARSPLPLHPQ